MLTPRLMFVAFAVSMVIECFASPQHASKTTSSNPVSIEQKLQARHIGLTIPELLEALKNPDPEIRGLSAMALADKHVDAVSQNQILNTLSDETVPEAKLNIAYALLLLGNKAGKIALVEGCTASEWPGYLRVRAASYLLRSGEPSCLDAMLSILKTGDSETRVQVLSWLQEFPTSNSEEVRNALRESLADSAPTVRIVASDTLAKTGTSADVPYLKAAISGEQDQTVRLQMQSSLRYLENRHNQ